jgi:hypothetical protein
MRVSSFVTAVPTGVDGRCNHCLLGIASLGTLRSTARVAESWGCQFLGWMAFQYCASPLEPWWQVLDLPLTPRVCGCRVVQPGLAAAAAAAAGAGAAAAAAAAAAAVLLQGRPCT